MKAALFVIIAIIGIAYYVVNYHSPFQTQVTDPYYVEIRIDITQSDVQLVGFGKMNSYEDCQGRAFLVWMKSLEHLGKVNVSSSCNKTLSKRYQKLFENQPSAATYVAFDKGMDGERDGRFLFYGIPSSHVYQACEKVIEQMRQTYTGKIFCVQGTVG